MAGPVTLRIEGAVATIALARPEAANSLDLATAGALVEAATTVDRDVAVRAVVLTGEGRMFCTGGDIGVMKAAGDRAAAALHELAGTLHQATSRLMRMQKPLICLVNGPAAGAGVGLAAMGDIVLAAASAHFTLAYTGIGLTPDGGASWLLPRLIGLRRTQELVLTNRRVGAEEAAAIGLVTRAVADDALVEEGMALARKLAEGPVGAFAASRALLLGSYAAGLEAQLELEARGIAAAAAGPEGQEGVAAFLGKRKPAFNA